MHEDADDVGMSATAGCGAAQSGERGAVGTAPTRCSGLPRPWHRRRRHHDFLMLASDHGKCRPDQSPPNLRHTKLLDCRYAHTLKGVGARIFCKRDTPLPFARPLL